MEGGDKKNFFILPLPNTNEGLQDEKSRGTSLTDVTDMRNEGEMSIKNDTEDLVVSLI